MKLPQGQEVFYLFVRKKAIQVLTTFVLQIEEQYSEDTGSPTFPTSTLSSEDAAAAESQA